MKSSMTPEQMRSAAAQHLVWNGYEVLEKDWGQEDIHMDFIARDPENNDLAFIDLYLGDVEKNVFPEPDLSRKTQMRFEKAMVAYVCQNDIPPCHIRFDCLTIYSCSAETACVRHHVDALRKAA